MLLRRAYGISWHEAQHVLPAWEVDVLLDALNASQDAGDEPTDEEV